MENYKDWEIKESDYNHFQATNLKDCDAYMIFAKSVEQLKLEIDEI